MEKLKPIFTIRRRIWLLILSGLALYLALVAFSFMDPVCIRLWFKPLINPF